YRLFNVVTHQSLRARLVKVNYVDQATGQAAGTRLGMFIEDEGDVAKRMEGRTVALPRMLFKDVESDTLMPMMIFEYMIGNTDFVAIRELLRALPDAIPGLDKASKEDVKSYIDEYFNQVKNTKDVRRLFIECKDKSTM